MLTTSITRLDDDEIVVRGRNLADELVGKIGFSDFFFLHAVGRMPTPSESALFAGLLVNSMDHGVNLPVLTARLTLGGAPDAIQGAIAAGILGIGAVGDGAIETVAKTLYHLAGQIDSGRSAEEVVRLFVDEQLASEGKIAGLGHTLHKARDPRVDRLFSLAADLGFSCRYVRLLEDVARQVSAAKGKTIPVNGAGAVAALYCELGFPAPIAKAATIVALSAGIAGHLMEELRRPMAKDIRKLVAKHVEYRDGP